MTKKTNEISNNFSGIKNCTELRVPDELNGDAVAAVKEPADNLLLPGMMSRGMNSLAVAAANAASAPAIVVLSANRWSPNQVLKVRFMDNPSPFVRGKSNTLQNNGEKLSASDFILEMLLMRRYELPARLAMGLGRMLERMP
ncbi:MAG: hypothetical protein M3Q99_16530 [Acidobacteriota bacterium]|nr:hypothetical protein [Acidobacteriota bacterium]